MQILYNMLVILHPFLNQHIFHRDQTMGKLLGVSSQGPLPRASLLQEFCGYASHISEYFLDILLKCQRNILIRTSYHIMLAGITPDSLN